MNLLTDVPEVMRELLCYHEALRKLGFASDDIFVVGSEVGEDFEGAVELRSQRLSFTITCGRMRRMTFKVFTACWARLIEAYNNELITEENFRAAWVGSLAFEHMRHLVAGLLGKGFYLPAGVGAVREEMRRRTAPVRASA